MKKIKLLTSLSSLAVVGTSVPIVATACSENKLSVVVDSFLSDKEIVQNDYGFIRLSCVAYEGESILFKNIQASPDVQGVSCTIDSLSGYSLGIIKVSVGKEVPINTECTVTISADDGDGHKATVKHSFKVVDTKLSIHVATAGESLFPEIPIPYLGKAIFATMPETADSKLDNPYIACVLNGNNVENLIPATFQSFSFTYIDVDIPINEDKIVALSEIGSDGFKPVPETNASTFEITTFNKKVIDDDTQTTKTGIYLGECNALATINEKEVSVNDWFFVIVSGAIA